jgi:DNA repair photolyase
LAGGKQRKPATNRSGDTRILLRPRKSRFVAIFRTTPTDTVCPNFYVLSHADGCAFSPHCSYCYLKSSLWHLNGQHVFTNLGRLLSEVRAWIAKDHLESYVLNSGNLSDSLTFEEFRPLIRDLIELFRSEAEARGRKHTLLLVTKGGLRECRPLLRARPCRNVVVSFSVNNPRAARRHESGAAPVAERLAAARRLARAGWRLRMRIDPMIRGYAYAPLARQVARLRPERVTLGTLRAEPNLERFVEEQNLFSALEPPATRRGLGRYPLGQRLALYGEAIRALAGVSPIGLCEETPDVWRALNLDAAAKPCNCGG